MKLCNSGWVKEFSSMIFPCQLASLSALVYMMVMTSIHAIAIRALCHDEQHENSAVPVPIRIAPSGRWDGNDGPWSSFSLKLGGRGNDDVFRQDVRLLPSTAGYNTWLIGTEGCPEGYISNCKDSRGSLYDRNKSSTYLMQSIYNTRLGSNLGLDTTGYAGYETIAFDQADRDDAQVTHVPIFDIADPKHWIGIFGLNPQPTNFSTLNNPQPSFMQRLYDQNSTPSRSFGYTAGARHRSDEAFGSLTLGGYDPSRFVPTDTTFAFYPDVERNLLVNLRSVSANATGRSNLLPDGQIGVHLDSTAAAVWLPESACKAFEATFHISWNDKVQRYIVNDSHHAHLEQINPIITFNLVNASGGSVDIDLPYTAFALTASFPIAEHGVTTRYFALRCAANDTQYTLGRVFFQEAYLIADYDRGQFTVAPCDWVTRIDRGYPLQPILSPQITANTKCEIQDPRHTLSRGGTAGVVVGCVAVVALISLPICVSVSGKFRQGSER